MGTKLCGDVVCGFPSPGEENREDSLDFNAYLVKHKACTFCLRAYGDSMYPSVKEGDVLVVDRSLACRNGDLVVAQLNGDFTVKYLRKGRNSFFLEPENKAYNSIEINADTVIFGVVTSVVRKLRK